MVLRLLRGISIHSLRMEGDCRIGRSISAGQYFNPLPPHGGRLTLFDRLDSGNCNFNPLPPHGGRHCFTGIVRCKYGISIHSLRMEGDCRNHQWNCCARKFQSTPSAWRETLLFLGGGTGRVISIHSLRMEGDRTTHRRRSPDWTFQSTPSAWRETRSRIVPPQKPLFQSTPSAWRETAKLHRKAFFISPILVQSCKKGCKRLHSAPEKMVFFEKREKNLVRNLQHLSVRL